MKKSFFKKLSFVLASAMVLTAVAPASGALAAKAPKLNAKSKYLHLDVEGKNEFNFNIKNKKKGWKYAWSSANEDVVTVNKKNGVVTAEGVGSTKVSVVITGKDGAEVDELSAKVTVRDNIKSLTITNKPEGDKLAVGESRNFNRDFVAVSGSTKKTSAITRWAVDKETATIKDNGVFVASAAGEYTITAMAFQSKAKYNTWLADKEANANLVLATDTYTVTVAPSMVSATQVDLDTFKVTFDSAVADVAENLTVYQMVGEAKVKELVKKVEMDADNKVATVDMYAITEGATYVVEYPDMGTVSFVAAKADAEEVTSMKIKTTQVEVGEGKELEVQLFNKEGVEITTDDLVDTRVTFDTSSDDAILIDNELTLFKVGDTAKVTATFHSFEYDNNTGEEIGNITAVGVVTCVDDILDVVSNIKAYTIDDNDVTSPDFDDVNHTFAANDNNKRLFVKLTLDIANEDDDLDFTNVDGNAEYAEKLGSDYFSKFDFKSSNESVLLVDENTGDLIPLKAGAAVVVVKYDDKTVGAVSVTITADRKLATAKLDATKVVLSNGFADEVVIGTTVKDQYGDDFDATIEALVDKAPKDVATNLLDASVNGDGDIVIKTNQPTETPKGTYTVKVTVEDGDVKRTLYVTVEVKEPGAISYYAIETDKASYDLKLKDGKAAPEVSISVYAYDKNGVKVDKLDTSEVEAAIKLSKAPDADDTFELDAVVSGDGIVLAAEEYFEIKAGSDVLVSGDAIKKVPTGTYQLTAVSGGKLGEYTLRPAAFKVVDTQVKAVAVVDDTYTSEDDPIEAIKKCISVKLDGKKQEDAGIVVPESDSFIKKTDKTIYIKKILFVEHIDGLGDLYHEVKVERTIRYDQ